MCNKENEIDLQNLYKFCKEKNEMLKEFVIEDNIVSDFIFNALKYNLKDSYNKKGIFENVLNSNHVIYNIMKNVDIFNKYEAENSLKNIYEYISIFFNKKAKDFINDDDNEICNDAEQISKHST